MNRTIRAHYCKFVLWTIFSISFTLAHREVAALSLVQPISPWPQFGGDAQGTRSSVYQGPSVEPSLKWFFPTETTMIPGPSGTLIYASPTIGVDGTIYAPSYNGYIYAINPDGTEKWRYFVGRFLRSSVTVAGDGTVYQLSSEGLLHLDQTGNVLFDNTSVASYDPSVTLDESRLFVANISEMSLREPDGTEVWSIDVGGLVEGTPVVGNDNTSYFGSQTGPGYLNAVDDQGQLLWRFTIPGRNVKSATIGEDGTIYAGGQGGDFFAINPDGTERWRFSESGEIYTAAAIGNDSVVFAATDAIYALDEDGNELWRYEDTSFGHGSVISDANGNIFATRNNRVIGLTSTGNLMWEYEFDPEIYIHSSVTLDQHGVLYFGASDGLYAISVPIPEPSAITILFLSMGCMNLMGLLRVH